MRLKVLLALVILVPVTSFFATAAELTLVEKEIGNTVNSLSLQEGSWSVTPPGLTLTEGRVLAEEPKAKAKVPVVPKESKPYKGAKYTQSISILDNRDMIRPFLIRRMLDRRWHQPGGLEGLKGWRSDKFRLVPKGGRLWIWIGNIGVENSFGYIQQNRGILRQYPDGTRFDELLVNTEVEPEQVFEHRVREKHDGKWHSDILYRNPKARPEGYIPVSLNKCASCHDEAGTGKYADGLVPGGDGVLSDPLDWSLIGVNPEQQPAPKPQPQQTQPQAQPQTQQMLFPVQQPDNCPT